MNKERISNSDLVWDRFPHIWYEGAFIGNGIYGASIYHDEKNNLILKLGHTRIFDNREPTELEKDPLYLLARLPIGYFTLKSGSEAVGCSERLDIGKAEATGTIQTETGSYSYRALAVRNRDIIIFEFSGNNESVSAEFTPFPALSPRYRHMIDIQDNNRMSRDYPSGKDSRDFSEDGISYHIQPLYNGGYYTTAYKELNTGENSCRILVTTQIGKTEKETVDACKNEISSAEINTDLLVEAHRRWWEEFYGKSSLEISAVEYEQFYNIQMYKAAASCAPDGRIFDTCGVWISENTAWPNAFWNLNVELSYSPLYVSDHLDLAHSLTNEIHNNLDDLRKNVAEEFRKDSFAIGRNTGPGLFAPVLNPGESGPDKQHEAGNLTWALFYCVKEYRMSGDKRILSDTVYPVLKGTVNYYLHFLYKGEDGYLHLPRTVSPEYLNIEGGDCNYDLALLRWALITLQEICEILNIKDEMLPVWKETYNNLCDYPHDDNEGYYITAGTKYDVSHRHYSHLLMFYPLTLLDLDNPIDRKLAVTSLEFWQSKPEALEGYSQTGAGAMRALLGDGNSALKHLKRLWKGFILPNTMYKENISPVLETPLAAATTIQEMLIQSHNGIIRIFPAVPEEWKDVSYSGFLCEGGFKVSAKSHNGRTTEISIKNLLGNKCILKADLSDFSSCSNVTSVGDNLYTVDFAGNDEVILRSNNSAELFAEYDTKLANCYGLNNAHDMLMNTL